MVRTQVSTFRVAAFLTSIIISLENSFSPILIFYFASIITIPLRLSVLVVIMIFASGSSFTGDLADLSFCFRRMFFASSVTTSFFGRFTHFFSRLFTHLFPLKWGDKGFFSFFPSLSHFLFGFFSMGQFDSSSIVLYI